ncbi:MAG: thioredoxin family protein, partial [Planctomycetota bacterium]
MSIRVTDMLNVDLSRYRFDFDLTLAAMTMHSDGTVYHRFGGRGNQNPNDWLTMPSLVSMLEASLEEHASYSRNPSPPKLAAKRTIRDLMPWAKRLKPEPGCIHCHMIHTAQLL